MIAYATSIEENSTFVVNVICLLSHTHTRTRIYKLTKVYYMISQNNLLYIYIYIYIRRANDTSRVRVQLSSS